MTMEIDHPLLFVGIGGTGGRIGLELQQRLRQEVRGPDGNWKFGAPNAGHLDYELPSCFQFINLDIDDADLQRLRDQVPSHQRAVARTMRTATKLLPTLPSYTEVAAYLRTAAEEQIRGWLPPADGEPRVAPLANGAGQLPTVGRACLFARVVQAGITAAQEPVTEAIERLRNCATDLAALGGLNPGSCDVFVAFSVAGGTGNGMFYDYIHLVADAFEHTGIAIQIYPLVVMPSAFAEGSGGGRNGMLNAGRALLDLSRLVDDQNMRRAHHTYGLDNGLSVTYRSGKVLKKIQIPASTMQTAFLFGRTAALTPAEMHASIVSFVLSVAGIRSAASALDGNATTAQSSFINQGIDRQASAPSGIGGRGMSTAAVASLSLPRAEILSLFAARLLSEAVEKIASTPREENNEPLLSEFFTATNLTELETTPHLGARGAERLGSARNRARAAVGEVEVHKQKVYGEARDLAARFDPRKGIAAMARESADPFRAERAVSGRGGPPGADTVTSFLGQNPADLEPGELPARPSQEKVKTWLDESATTEWFTAWAAQSPEWAPKLDQQAETLRALTEALREFKAASDKGFKDEVKRLFTDHATRRRFLHDLPRNAGEFYRQFARRLAESLDLDPGVADDPGLLMARLLDEDKPWEKVILDSVYGLDIRSGTKEAVSGLHERISSRVRAQTEKKPKLLPHLADLIDAARSQSDGLEGADAMRSTLRGMVPTGMLMSAAGPAKILIIYPAKTTAVSQEAGGTGSAVSADGRPQLHRDPEVEDYLRSMIEIGTQHGEVFYEYRPTAAETLTVVMMRSALGVTDIPEARKVMSEWSDALRHGGNKDKLRWRQRLGYDYEWLLTTEQQRVDILQRLLIAMRNGQVDLVSGTATVPVEIAIRSSADPYSGAARLHLRLRPWDEASPWADLLHAYEESILGGDELNRQEMYDRLMTVVPVRDPASGRAIEPAAIYKEFLQVRDDEVLKLEDLLANAPLDPDQRLQVISLRDFWQDTVSAARSKKIDGFTGLRSTLEALD